MLRYYDDKTSKKCEKINKKIKNSKKLKKRYTKTKKCVIIKQQTKGGNIMAFKINDSCIACGACAGNCPTSAISEGDIYVIDAEACISCGACAEACPVGAPEEE